MAVATQVFSLGFNGGSGQKPEMSPARRKTENPKKRGKVALIEIEKAQERRRRKREEYARTERAIRQEQKCAEKLARPKMSVGKKLAAVCVVVGAVLLFGWNGIRNLELSLERADAQQLYEERVAEKARLELELSAVHDPEYIEQQARERFHMLKDGEILYVLPGLEADNTQ
jgi:cell division protein FtsB